MKKYKLIALAAAFSLALAATPILVHGDESAYTSDTDPLISLSYIEKILTPEYDSKLEDIEDKYEILDEIITMLQTSLSKANVKIAELEAKIAELEAAEPETGLGQYEVVYLKRGAKLLAQSPCEIILRSGTAIIVSITANGVNDISDGSELMNAVDVPLYHCLLVPRGGDGRGIQVTSDDAYIMVRGDYQIVE